MGRRELTRTMVKRRVTWAALAALHLLLVALGATHLRLPTQALDSLAEAYGSVNGSNLAYLFFAPDIGPELRARFEIVDANGKKTQDMLETQASRETVLRIGNIIGLMRESVIDPQARKEITSAWAGKMFGRHPHAQKVTVILEQLDPPPIELYRQGHRAKWELFYQASFAKKGAGR